MLELVAKLPAEQRAAIERELPPDALEAVRSTSALAWVDMRHNVAITHVVCSHLGPQATRAFFRAFLNVAYDSPLMRNFMQAALRISQRDVALGLRLMPKGYDLIFKNVGRFRPPDIQEGEAHLSLRDLPDMCIKDDLWLESVAGSLESVFDLGGREGTVEISKVDHGLGNLDLHLRWR